MYGFHRIALRLLLAVMLSFFLGLSLSSCKQGNAVADQSLDRIEQVVEQHPSLPTVIDFFSSATVSYLCDFASKPSSQKHAHSILY